MPHPPPSRARADAEQFLCTQISPGAPPASSRPFAASECPCHRSMVIEWLAYGAAGTSTKCTRTAPLATRLARRPVAGSSSSSSSSSSSTSSSTSTSPSLNQKSPLDVDALDALGVAMRRAMQAKAAAKAIADAHPERPLTAIAEAAWRGAPELMDSGDALTALSPHVAERFGPVVSVLTMANSHTVETTDGLVVIDCGTFINAMRIRPLLAAQGCTDERLHTVIYTHGHVDHVSAQFMGFDEPYRVVSHDAVPARFDRYKKTRGYNTFINKRQFQIPDSIPFDFPNEFRYPDLTYKDKLRLEIGGEIFELFAAKGETDDATIVWMPERRFCFCGDLFIWNSPNASNPQKVQRFPEEWATAARFIADELRPLIVFPGHGPPLVGEARVLEAFTDQAKLLEGICEYTFEGINAGKSLATIMMSVPIPRHLVAKPYLRPRYDDPRWFVASLWRRYCGWYDFDVRHLLPVSSRETGLAVAQLVPGGTKAMATHAAKMVEESGNLGIALEIAELAAAAAGETSKYEHEVRSKVLRALEKREPSLMASSIYRAAAQDSEDLLASKI
jgi:glyoxylase-like metal-dependent hydrolase (beta-lactamase superfamily II)